VETRLGRRAHVLALPLCGSTSRANEADDACRVVNIACETLMRKARNAIQESSEPSVMTLVDSPLQGGSNLFETALITHPRVCVYFFLSLFFSLFSFVHGFERSAHRSLPRSARHDRAFSILSETLAEPPTDRCNSRGTAFDEQIGLPKRREDPGCSGGSQYRPGPRRLLSRRTVLRGDGIPGTRGSLPVSQDAYHCRGRAFHADWRQDT